MFAANWMADRVGKDLLQSIYRETGFDPTKLGVANCAALRRMKAC